MPTTREVGTYGPANDAIGGEVTLYAYDIGNLGRGEVMRLFFEDAQVKWKDVRFTLEDANSISVEDRIKINPVGSLPGLEVNGKQFAQSYAMLRYFSGRLGKYDGKTAEERYFVDMICDIASDWRTSFVTTSLRVDEAGFNFNPDPKPFEHHKSFLMPRFIKGLEKHLSTSPHSTSGPFVLGSEIAYADFVLWQIAHDERELKGGILEILDASAPRLKELLKGVAARPNVRAYRESERYVDDRSLYI